MSTLRILPLTNDQILLMVKLKLLPSKLGHALWDLPRKRGLTTKREHTLFIALSVGLALLDAGVPMLILRLL